MDSPQDYLTLPLLLDKRVAPLLDQASRLELKLVLGELTLSFPVTLSHAHGNQEQIELSVPHIMSHSANTVNDSHGGARDPAIHDASNSSHPRAWRLPAPQHIQLKHANGKPLAAEIRDLSINGMRLLSRRPLFSAEKFSGKKSSSPAQSRTLLLSVGAQILRCKITLVRQHKGPAFWLTAVQFQLNSADQRTLSDFVFQGFLAEIEKKQAP